jgi:hypothetical protein
MKIVEADGVPQFVTVRLETTDGRSFWMQVGSDGLKFHSDRNSAGTLTDNPIIKSADDVFDWVKNDRFGSSHKRFGERVRTQPKG